MKLAYALATIPALCALIAEPVQSRQMHAKLDYDRYLQEKETVQDEYKAWMSRYRDVAEMNGFMPHKNGKYFKVKTRKANPKVGGEADPAMLDNEADSDDDDSDEDEDEDEKEDRLQRYQVAKQEVEELNKTNPDAVFSLDTPFTLMSDEEFTTFVHKGFGSFVPGQGGAADAIHNERRLRGQHHSNGNGFGRSIRNLLNFGNRAGDDKGEKMTRGPYQGGFGGAPQGDSTQSHTIHKSFGSFADLQKWFQDYMSGKVTPGSNGGGNDSPSPNPVGPVAPTYAPTSAPEPTTETPAADDNRPVAPTYAPSSDDSNLPVAPTYSPSSASTGKEATPEAATNGDKAPGPDMNGADAYDWTETPCITTPRNQGQCGSCWAFAATAAMEAAVCIKNGEKSVATYSPQQIVDCDQQNLGCQGGATMYALQYTQETGLCLEQDYPYTSMNGQSGRCDNSCSKVQTGMTGIERPNGEQGLVEAVKARPVIVGIAAGNPAWKQYVRGTISDCPSSQIDHAVVVVGYDEKSFKIKNSWGEEWGEEGFARIARGGGAAGTCQMYTDMYQPVM